MTCFSMVGTIPALWAFSRWTRLHPILSLELAGKEEGASAIDGGQGGLDSGDVVHGEGEEVALFDRRVCGGDAGKRIGAEAVVGELDCLGGAGGSRGEEEEGCVGVGGCGEVKFVV